MDNLHLIPDGILEVRYSTGRQDLSPVSFDTHSPSMKMGSNCLLIQKNGKNILIDTGTGLFNPDENKYCIEHPRKLLSELQNIGVKPYNINIVILTHFHFDHCGGCIDKNNEPVFSNAIHYIQFREVQFAEKDPTLSKYWSVFKDILGKCNLLRIIDGDFNLEESVELRLSPGHTAGLQYAKFNINGQNYIFPGDIIPTLWHLNNDNIIYLDYNPSALKKAKKQIINDCIENDAIIVFQHSTRPSMGKLMKKDTRIGFRRIV